MDRKTKYENAMRDGKFVVAWGQEGAEEFLQQYHELLRLVGAGYKREGKRYLTLAVGCTGGKHRSVAIAEELKAKTLEIFEPWLAKMSDAD